MEADPVLHGYAVDAAALFDAYEALDSAAVLAPVADLLPPPSSTVVDIGAGTGRDAAWLARLGYRVTAVEPVAALRESGMVKHAACGITWLDDQLPSLGRLTGRYDVVLLAGVWHHLDDDARQTAMPRLATLVGDGGLVILSIRHGPALSSRPVYGCDPDDTLAAAAAAGLALVRRREAGSLQQANRAAGVRWTWLALRR